MSDYNSSSARLERAKQGLQQTSSEEWRQAISSAKWTKCFYRTVGEKWETEDVFLDESDSDLSFMLHCRDDLAHLLESSELELESLHAIRQRHLKTTKGNWEAWLESQGSGGQSMIQIYSEATPIEVEIYCYHLEDGYLDFINDSHALIRELLPTLSPVTEAPP